MNRLTDKWYVGKGTNVPHSCPPIKQLYDRLGEYENCELSPTQILLLKDKVNEKVVENNNGKSINLNGLTAEQILLVLQMVNRFKLHNETQEHLKTLNNKVTSYYSRAVAV